MEMSLSTLVLVRHGASEWTTAQRYQGHASVLLSDLGHAQAAACAWELHESNRHFQRLFASDLRRAAETAKYFAQLFNLPIRYDARLRELDCGDWTGKTHSEIRASVPDVIARLAAGEDVPRGGKECLADLEARVADFLVSTNSELQGAIVVAHAYTLRVLLRHLTQQTLDLLHLGAYSVLHWNDTLWELEQHNIVAKTAPIMSAQWIPTF